MKFVIQNPEHAQKWIEIFKIIKYLNSYTTICAQEKEMLIQIMDDSHVCLLNINIEKWWFEDYNSKNETLSFMTTIMVKLLHLYVPKTTMIFETINEKLQITFKYENKTEKIFELPLIEIDKDLLDSQEIEGSLECCLETKAFDKYISEMMLFGDSMEFVCYKENLFMKSSGEEGNYSLKMPYEVLDELVIEEDLQLRTRVSLKYLYYLTKSHNVFKKIKLKIQQDVPFHVVIEECMFKLKYYIAPKINDDEDEREDFGEFEDDAYENLENKVM